MITEQRITIIACLFLSSAILFTSCTSTTLIQSNPGQAKVYVNGEFKGTTPYAYSDTKIVGSSTAIKIEKEGYDPYTTRLKRDEEADIGAIIAGVFFIFPFLWTMKYLPSHTYELNPNKVTPKIETVGSAPAPAPAPPSTKTDRLRELKKLLDEKIITQQEFEAEKKKILEEK